MTTALRLVFRLVGNARILSWSIGQVNELRHFDATLEQRVMEKAQGGHGVYMKKLEKL
jgi:predicted trehalose synthase